MNKNDKNMKKIVFTIALVLSLGLSNAWAEGNGNSTNETNSSVRTIKSPRFARPLVEKWIEEYAKTEPGVEFQIVKGSAKQDRSTSGRSQGENSFSGRTSACGDMLSPLNVVLVVPVVVLLLALVVSSSPAQN